MNYEVSLLKKRENMKEENDLAIAGIVTIGFLIIISITFVLIKKL